MNIEQIQMEMRKRIEKNIEDQVSKMLHGHGYTDKKPENNNFHPGFISFKAIP